VLCALVWAIGLLLFLPAASLRASDFHVNPVHVFLTAKSSSALLALRNTSAENLRFQVNAFAWEQSPEGEMMLSPTEDIIVFPALAAVAAGTRRNIRIGRVTSIGDMEKTYRVFIEELPSQKKEETERQSQVQLLTKMGVPVFLSPHKPKLEGRLEELAVRRGMLTFKLRNTGNTHFIPQGISVKALGEKGETVFVIEPTGWYILAAGYRAFQLELPKQQCGKARSVTIVAKVAKIILNESLAMEPGWCTE
jgi:fimbrial chaperone protein